MVLVRAETDADLDRVADLHRAAFGGHGDRVAGLVTGLRRLITEQAGLSLVAESDGVPVGHLMCTPALLDAPQRLVTVEVLSPLGVLPGRQRQGVGSALVRRAVELLAARAVPALFLEGDPAYYSRLGFQAGGPLGYRRPSLRIPPAAFQVLQLPAHEPWMTGTLVYPPVFWEHDLVGLRGARLAAAISATALPE
jgi:putative acetyltransferase